MALPDDMSDAKREIYECHDCYGNDEDCDRCFGTNRVCSLCELGACGARQIRVDGRLPFHWSEVCSAPEIRRGQELIEAKEAEFQNKRQEKLSARLEALRFAREMLQDLSADEHTRALCNDTIAVFDVWIEELSR